MLLNPTLLPYTTLFRSDQRAARGHEGGQLLARLVLVGVAAPRHGAQAEPAHRESTVTEIALLHDPSLLDRKSTRLNSSHPSISYAVFCLKKKRFTPTQS